MARPRAAPGLAFAIALALLHLSSCSPAPGTAPHAPDTSPRAEPDRSIALAKPWRTLRGLTVENGSAFDQAAVELEGARKVIVPDTAVVRPGGDGQRLQIFMRKALAYRGQSAEPLGIRTTRNQMGCATRSEAGALAVATFGEWDSRIEGGASMGVVVLVPTGVEVEKRPGLSGPQEEDRVAHAHHPTRPKEVRAGWTAVPDVPDPDRKAGG